MCYLCTRFVPKYGLTFVVYTSEMAIARGLQENNERTSVRTGAPSRLTGDQRTLIAGSEWTVWVELPLGVDFVLDRAGHNLPYAIQTRTTSGHTGDPRTIAADPVDDKRTPCERQVGLGSNVGALRLRMTDPRAERAKFNLAFFSFGKGPCS